MSPQMLLLLSRRWKDPVNKTDRTNWIEPIVSKRENENQEQEPLEELTHPLGKASSTYKKENWYKLVK